MKRYYVFMFIVLILLSAGCIFGGDDDKDNKKDEIVEPREMKMISIPAGNFMMGAVDGDEDESPVHKVTLSAFKMSETEITQGQYESITGKSGSYDKDGINYPADYVSWEFAVEFCNLLSDAKGFERCYEHDDTGLGKWNCDFSKNGFRLPTEAEWEYACRAGSTTRYSPGDEASSLDSMAWMSQNSGNKVHPVAQKEPNAFGLYDMHGNVWEFCHDYYAVDYYANSP